MMKIRLIIFTVGLIAAVLTTPAWAFDVHRSITEARILRATATASVIQLDFKAQLSRDIANPVGSDVVVTWEQVGGVSPVPYKITIPVGCFVADRVLHVDDFRLCGVRMTVDLGRGPMALLIREFEARFIRRRDGTVRFDVETSFMDNGQEAAILGVLGGAAVEMVIGDGVGSSLPSSIETVSGIDPTPF